MTRTPLPENQDAAELRRCLRDLIGLLGLPALWSSNDPAAVLRLLGETLVEMLSLEACHVTSMLSGRERPLSALFVNGALTDLQDNRDWAAFAQSAAVAAHKSGIHVESTPLGTLNVVRFPMGWDGVSGQIVAGSSRPDFPDASELILLRSAASLAANGLRTASLNIEKERALRAKDEFLAMLGHELRNPLAPIVTALGLLRLKAGENLPSEHIIIERQVASLKSLVDDLLDVTRIASGKIELKKELVQVHSVVQLALEAARPLISERRHHVDCDTPAGDLAVHGDPARLTQVLTNLIINAAKYTQPEGRIAVSARRDRGDVVLEIMDNGVGIEPELLPHVFDIFEQGKVTPDRSRGGLGIGLAVVKSLVALHGGSVEARSEGLGRGSVFAVRIPLAEPAPPAPAPSSPSAGALHEHPALAAERILVVDDNQDAADLLGMFLRACGHEVHVAYSPMGALAHSENAPPTIAIVDIGLPEMTGYELASKLRACADNAAPRIIAVTGYGQAHDRALSQQAGIEAHFVKPVPLDALLKHLHRGTEPSTLP